MPNPKTGSIVTTTFIAFILLGLFLTSRIDLAFSSDLETFSGPRAYPAMILSVLLLLNLIRAATQIRGKKQVGTDGTSGEPFFGPRAIWSAFLFLALLVFLLTFESVGYILTMVPLLAFVAWLSGARSLLFNFITAVFLSAICLVIFRYGLSTVLPEGVFGIDDVF